MSARIDTIRNAMALWARHDIDALLELVTDDVEWHFHVGTAPVIGKESMRALLEQLQHHHNDSRWRLVHAAEAGDVVLIEAVDDYVSSDGHRAATPYAGVYEFDGDRIARWRDYFDFRLMRSLEKGDPSPEHVVTLAARGD